MVKFLLVISIVSLVGYLVYLRLRPYIHIARRVLGVVKDARRISTEGPSAVGAPPRAAGRGVEKLVRCASCGTWLPASRALTFRASQSAYCSQACLERSAGEERTPRAAGKL